MAPPIAVTGMNDILPGESARWQALETAFRTVCDRYGYREVRTPVCEYVELFSRGIGGGTDIVQKEMYTFDDRGERTLALRPEGTAGAVRAVLEHGVLAKEPVVRWYYTGPMFRAERPAKGRYRQFYQVGVEVYGDASPAADAECIELATRFIRDLGITDVKVRVNSLGGEGTRARYRDALVAYFTPLREQLSPESQSRLERNPLRILDSKDPRDLPLKAAAPSILDALDPDDRAHFDAVCALLHTLEVAHVVDPTLVRGLDYYTRTVFEIVDTSGSLGAQDALGGGGRYDRLFLNLGADASVPAFGFGLGVERLLLSAPEPVARKGFSVAVVAAAKGDNLTVTGAALALARDLRAREVTAHVDTRFVSMKSQFRRADDLGASMVLILGDSEVQSGEVTVKTMATGVQERLPRAQAIEAVLAARSV
jgi:histidyl-tRNA synthetase